MDSIKNKKILLVDDEPQLLNMLETIFRKDGFVDILTASNFKEAITATINNKPDLAVLDVMLPDGDGFSLISEIKRHCDIPILFLSARGEAEDKILGLGLGADDYIVKPFLPKELTLRVNAIIKRTYAKITKEELPIFHLPGCTIDLRNAEVIKDKEKIQLTAKEHSILLVLYENANKIVTTDTLCRAAWEEDSFGLENTLMVHIRHIREKVEENPSKPVSLVTIKGLGYKLLTKGR